MLVNLGDISDESLIDPSKHELTKELDLVRGIVNILRGNVFYI